MAPTSTTEETLTLDRIYTEVRAGIRETDNISFRLLGLVPLVSGATLIGVILGEDKVSPAGALLSLFAAGITLGILRWELRNSQTCKWLIRYADRLERYALNSHEAGPIHHGVAPDARHFGKIAGEKAIYLTTILTWLLLPLSSWAVSSTPPMEILVGYVVLAVVILAHTGMTLWAEMNLDERRDAQPETSGRDHRPGDPPSPDL